MKNFQWLRKSENLLLVAAVLMTLYQLLYTQLVPYETGIHRIIHLGLSFVVTLLAIFVGARKPVRFVTAFLLLLSVATTAELVVIFPKVLGSFVLPPVQAMVGGNMGLLLCFVLTWWRYGKLFPVICFGVFAYVIFGPYVLPEALKPPEVSLLRILSWTGGDIASESGAYGGLVGFMSTYMWLFMIIGAFLQAFGGMRCIQGIGALVSTKLSSGPAALAVVCSSLVGMVTGVTGANIAVVGSFTIPLMKKAGYTSEEAAAIEEAASAGGQIMPPVMGVTAFIMAEFIGMTYFKLTLHAYVPALFYFFAVFLYIQLRAMKAHHKPLPGKVDRKALLLDLPLFIVPFAVLILLLMRGYSLMFVAFWSIGATVAVGLMSHALRKGARINWSDARDKLVGAAVMASEITVICGVLGALTGILEMSGVGYMMGNFALRISGGNLFLLLTFTAVVCLILGCGLPTISSYILTATVLAPPIVSLGVPVLAAHMFVFVYAVFANLTPPIGFGIVVASAMAKSDYWRTAGEGLKVAFLAMLLPYFFVYTPAILLLFKGLSGLDILRHFAIVLTFTISLSCVLANYCLTKLHIVEWVLFAIGIAFPLLSLAVSTMQGSLLAWIGVIGCAGGIWLSYLRRRKKLTLQGAVDLKEA